jgi:hypothetical protein
VAPVVDCLVAGLAPQLPGIVVAQGAARGRIGEHNEAQVIDNPHWLRDLFQDPGQQCLRR